MPGSSRHFLVRCLDGAMCRMCVSCPWVCDLDIVGSLRYDRLVLVYDHWCLMVRVVVNVHGANGLDGIGLGLLLMVCSFGVGWISIGVA